MKPLCRGIVVLALVAMPACAQVVPSHAHTVSPKDADTSSFVGCYELDMGRWWPWGFGDGGGYFRPPDRIQLFGERGTNGFEQGQLLIRRIPRQELPADNREGSYWEIKPQNQVLLEWTDGLVGVTLDLKKNGKELTGWAHPHSDAGMFVPRVAHVTARPITCAPATN